MQPLCHAKIHFNDHGTPVASDFDDIYFSNEGGLAETDYVFLQQNGLPERWQQHPLRHFHIMETGFGTGANFLLSWQRFRAFRKRSPDASCQRLYFSSFEQFPLTLADLQQALQALPQLAELHQALLAVYPPALSGCHRLVFDQGNVVLDLWLGDVNHLLPQLPLSKVDAFFLDGFAPGKNPQMWQPELFAQLARFSGEHSSVATFTAAGLVKRGLADAGFVVKKVKGFGRKRDMLTAIWPGPDKLSPAPEQAVVIVGAGLAGLTLALKLVQQGRAVQMLCADAKVATGASHNRQGAFYPNLNATLNPASLLHSAAFYYGRQHYQHCIEQGMDIPLDWCGVLHLASNEQLQQKQHALLSQGNWPTRLVHGVDAAEASELAQLPLPCGGIFFQQGGWLSPQTYCQAVFNYLQQQSLFSAVFNCRLEQLQHQGEQWLLSCSDGQHYLASCVVLASGADLTSLAPFTVLPLRKVRGQVSHIEQAPLTSLKTVICHKGYLTPAWQGQHAVGATFDRDSKHCDVLEQDNVDNLAQLNQQLQQPGWFAGAKVVGAKAAFRATLPDHLPMAGAWQQQPELMVFSGLGARGLLFAPLLAEYIACQLTRLPLPLTTITANSLSPMRFLKA